MTPKIQRITTEIDRLRTRIAESKERLHELERQRTELENTEIVALFRSLEVAPDQLPAFIAAMKESPALSEPDPADFGSEAAPATASYTSGYTREQEDIDHEE